MAKIESSVLTRQRSWMPDDLKLKGICHCVALLACLGLAACTGLVQSKSAGGGPQITVTISSGAQSLQTSQSANFSASVQNDSQNKGVTWSLSGNGCSGNACGVLTNVTATSVTFTAPAAVPNPPTVVLTATSVAQSSISASNSITITAAPAISVAVNPATASVQVSAFQNFGVTIQNDSSGKGVTWSLSGAGCTGNACGTLTNVTSSSVRYTAPATVPNPASVTLKATSAADTSKSGSASITVTSAPPPISVSVTPPSASLTVAQSTAFTASVQNDSSNKGVTWSLSGTGCAGAACGTLANATASSVTVTAPATVPNPPAVTLTATSISDNTKSGAAKITITAAPAITVSVSPGSASIQVSQSAGFTASVKNDSSSKGVTWTLSGSGCSGTACGTLSNVTTISVTVNAPSSVPNPSTVNLTATSVADGTKSGSAVLTITPASANITISPRRGSLTLTQTQQFQTNLPVSSVTWSVDGVSGGNTTVGTVSSAGLYTPGIQVGSHIIVVTDNANSANAATAVFAVTDFAGTFTAHNDNGRTGQNLQEYALTTATVNASQFGKRFSCAIDGYTYAQPLYVANLQFSAGVFHNVVFVATENDSVYAFDADANPCVQLWKTSFLSTGVTAVPSSDPPDTNLLPKIGITGTPVIDPQAKTIYLVAKTKETVGTGCSSSSPCYVQRLHALDLIAGTEKTGSPIIISGSVPGTGIGSAGGSVAWTALHHLQRPGLLLSNGVVYIAFGSHDDNDPYHGWVLGYDSNTLKQTMVYNTTPDGTQGSIWMAGGGIAADSTGNIYFITANGTFDANGGGNDYSDSIVKISPSGTVLDWFTPFNQADLSSRDVDLGSTGAMLLPDQSGSHPHEVLGGGKGGVWYLLDRDNMGHFNPVDNSQIVQSVTVNLTSGAVLSGMFDSPAYWNGNLYVSANGDTLKAFSISSGLLSFSPTTTSNVGNFSFPAPSPVVSASGSTNGIVWVMSSAGSTLHAFDATNLANELYNSGQASGGRDQTGTGVKFSCPTVANGKVYVGTQTELDVFGLLP
jgi:hypothetical protein